MEVKSYLIFRPRVPRVLHYAGLWVLMFGLGSVLCAAANPLTLVVQWNNAALQGDRDSSFGPPMIARALAIVHTCMYDAWAAYDAKAIGTQLGGTLRRPASERTLANKQQAISYGAYRALVDLFAFDKPLFDAQMTSLGYDPNDNSTDITTPTGIGNVAYGAVLNFRHHDGSNQLGDLHPGAYSDYAGYVPVNSPSTVPNPSLGAPGLGTSSDGLKGGPVAVAVFVIP